MNRWLKVGVGLVLGFVVLMLVGVWLAYKPTPTEIQYGMSFNTFYATDLGLDWREAYEAILTELGVEHLRLAAHWPMVEPEQGVFNFTELDYQIRRAEEEGADIILAVGRRLPRWPECHVPEWARGLSKEEQQEELLTYITAVVERYRDHESIIYWQVENEPFLEIFAFEHCGHTDLEFFEREIAHFRELDPERPLLVTDSGNLGTWHNAYRLGDAFGTSVYIYFWNPELGQFRTILPPWFYRLKEGVMELVYGEKPTFLIELSVEPWLVEPITNVPIATQYSRMNLDKFNDIISYARDTRYDRQYLWGAEWWYWLLLQGEPAMWERGREVFGQVDSKADQLNDETATTPVTERSYTDVRVGDLSLTPEQATLLRTFGLGEDFVITEAMQACGSEALGAERTQAVLAGAAPSLTEAYALFGCLRD